MRDFAKPLKATTRQPAEVMEGRRPAEENLQQQTLHRTPRRVRMQQS
jgi:hypothetical protein